ncbi:hypothetical protein CMO89_00615 [Candidatus Woesearchaeota archaeon]|nr:hypothetical protein [Candidatus Woesearchaeota archaeon]|tara:strand:- start:11633 stop:12061 length:429 start_codon:yes stop_codon:yes gene_type:complete
MKRFFSQIKDKFKSYTEGEEEPSEEGEEGYVELNTEGEEEIKSKIMVRPFVMNDFEDIREILDSLREGYTIALINIKPLKDKDLVELKRAVNKLKKTCDAVEGEIAGFGEDYIVATPSFARIYKSKESSEITTDTEEITKEE